MSFPDFFQQVPPIRLHDGLSETLGATKDGIVEYNYTDAVKLAGHSCPTVGSAWLSAVVAINALYGDETPERGDIEVQLPGGESEGVTGVIGQVLTLVTGATDKNGFHGLGGKYVRQGLLHYNQQQVEGIRFTRKDTGATVEVNIDARSIPGNPAQGELLGKILYNQATPEEKTAFGEMWQDRVRRLLTEHNDDPAVVHVHKVA